MVGLQTICTTRNLKGLVKADPGTIAKLILKANQKPGSLTSDMEATADYKGLLSGVIFVGADVVSCVYLVCVKHAD